MARPDDGNAGGADDRTFDEIVRGLDMDLPFPEPPRPTPTPPPTPQVEEDVDLDDLPPDDEEKFYREVPAGDVRPRDRRTRLALMTLVMAPGSLVVATLIGVILPRPIVAAVCITFIAAVIWLFTRLPEHGPADDDWPDNGAQI